jgi:DnaJ-class molecular chaperone
VTAPVFGSLVLCAYCHGAGRIRHRKDPAAAWARERERRRHPGEAVASPPPFDPCPDCQGTGYLPPAVDATAIDLDPSTRA